MEPSKIIDTLETATATDNSAGNWHVDGDLSCAGFSLEEERVMQHRSSKYFPQFEIGRAHV